MCQNVSFVFWFLKKWKLDGGGNHISLFTKGQVGRIELLYIWLEAAGVPVRKEALAAQLLFELDITYPGFVQHRCQGGTQKKMNTL